MFQDIKLQNVLFLDIETVPGKPDFADLDETFQTLWASKAKSLLRKSEGEPSEEETVKLYERAGIYAEFGKIICISVGVLRPKGEGEGFALRVKSFADHDEKVLLEGFAALMAKSYHDSRAHFICGHNIKEFDIPYICRRMLVNQVPLPDLLDLAGKKPWETKHLLDTLDMWKFGDYKHYTSLKLLTALFGIPSPKDDIDGSQVGRVYWQEKDLERIAVYCEKDVVATAQLLMRFMGLPIPDAADVVRRS